MKTTQSTSILQNNLVRFALGTAAILMIPLLGRWPWSLFDFVIMGSLLFGTGVVYEVLSKLVGKNHRAILAVVLLAALLLTWVELAVGIFGTPFAGN